MGQAQSISLDGANYGLVGVKVGDQVFPQLGLAPAGGYVVWEDNGSDGDGWGVMARRVDVNLSGILGSFQVNEQVAGDQKKPSVAALADGGALLAWQGGEFGYENIWIRILRPDGTFSTASEVQVNTFTAGSQSAPRVARLVDGNVVVVWNSLNQDGDMLGVYGRVVSPTASFLTAPFRLNQRTALNQRDVDVTALSGGGFVAAWISEGQGVIPDPRVLHQVHIFTRMYTAEGEPVTDEFRADGTGFVCANPKVAGDASGGFTVVWSNKDLDQENSWDIGARRVRADAQFLGGDFRINEFQYGDQYAPSIASLGANQLVVWSSLGQDGSWEGVFAQLLVEGQKVGGELAVNTQKGSRQIQPVVASDGQGKFLVSWSNYTWDSSFDVLGQRFSSTQALPRMMAPWLSSLSQSRVMVTWPELAGYPVVYYHVHIDGGPAIAVSNSVYLASGFGAATVHSFRVGYVLPGNQISPLSDPAAIRTWDEDLTGDGLPDDYQEWYWGEDKETWGSGAQDSDGDGVTNFNEFLAGTDPTNPQSVLRMWMTQAEHGPVLHWSTRPGFIYQVQQAPHLDNWLNVGTPRLAAGVIDAMVVTTMTDAGYYRVVRVR